MLAYARSVLRRVLQMRSLALCLIAVSALAFGPGAALAASAGSTSAGGTSLLESGGGSSSSGAGSSGSGTGSSSSGTGSTGSSGSSGQTSESEAKKSAEGTTSGEESGSFTSFPIIGGMAAAALLIAGIAIFIMRDARRNAPVPEGALTGAAQLRADHAHRRKAKAKAAKQQRKRNRPR